MATDSSCYELIKYLTRAMERRSVVEQVSGIQMSIQQESHGHRRILAPTDIRLNQYPLTEICSRIMPGRAIGIDLGTTYS